MSETLRKFIWITAVSLGMILLGFRSEIFKQSSSGDAIKAFYFWKVRWAPTASELKSLSDLGINRLYLRFFDIGWDPSKNYPEPVAPIQFQASLPNGTSIVPVVYIKNQTFQKIQDSQLPKFANQVWDKVREISTENKIGFAQWQIDCDWTESTRASYFRFLELVRKQSHAQGVTLSATIRLHQVKYPARTGVPPVDRGMLMFYNMGRLQSSGPAVSIFNSADAERYTASLKNYKMELDVVLPIFSWLIHSRNGHVGGLVEKMDLAEIDSTNFAKHSDREYFATHSFFMHGIYFKKDDVISVEEITPQATHEAAALVARSLRRGQHPGAIAFFDFDERNLKKYENNDLKTVFNYFD